MQQPVDLHDRAQVHAAEKTLSQEHITMHNVLRQHHKPHRSDPNHPQTDAEIYKKRDSTVPAAAPPRRNKIVLKVKKGALRLSQKPHEHASEVPPRQEHEARGAPTSQPPKVAGSPTLKPPRGEARRDELLRKSKKKMFGRLSSIPSSAQTKESPSKLKKKIKKRSKDSRHYAKRDAGAMDLLLMATTAPCGTDNTHVKSHTAAVPSIVPNEGAEARRNTFASRIGTLNGKGLVQNTVLGIRESNDPKEKDISDKVASPKDQSYESPDASKITSKERVVNRGDCAAGAALDTYKRMSAFLQQSATETTRQEKAGEENDDAGTNAALRWLKLIASDAESRIHALKDSRERVARATLGVDLFHIERYRSQNRAAVEATEEMLNIMEASLHHEENNLNQWLETIKDMGRLVEGSLGTPPDHLEPIIANGEVATGEQSAASDLQLNP